MDNIVKELKDRALSELLKWEEVEIGVGLEAGRGFVACRKPFLLPGLDFQVEGDRGLLILPRPVLIRELRMVGGSFIVDSPVKKMVMSAIDSGMDYPNKTGPHVEVLVWNEELLKFRGEKLVAFMILAVPQTPSPALWGTPPLPR